MRGWTLAIDFGTSFTTAATWSDGQVSVLEIENSRYLPSLVCLGEDGSLLTGAAARQLAAQLAGNAERAPKRSLIRSPEVRLGSRTVACTDLAGAVLGRVYAEALAHHPGDPPGRVVLTHPAAWRDHELSLLVKAAQAAGLAEPVLLPEPVAAALHYAREREFPAAGHVAVYDLGGGTFDVAVLRRTASGAGFEVVGSPGGDPDLGGEDLTEALRELVGRHARERDPRPWDELWALAGAAGARERAVARRDISEAKEALSATTSVRISVRGYPEPFLVGRHEYEEAIEDCLQRSITRLASTVASAGLSPADLAAVLLAGGASRTPRVSDLLAGQLGPLPLTSADPKCAVVLGALAGTVQSPAPADARRHGPERDTRAPRLFHHVTADQFGEA